MRIARLIGATLGLTAVAVTIAGAWWVRSLGPPPLGDGLALSTQVLDRHGQL